MYRAGLPVKIQSLMKRIEYAATTQEILTTMYCRLGSEIKNYAEILLVA